MAVWKEQSSHALLLGLLQGTDFISNPFVSAWPVMNRLCCLPSFWTKYKTTLFIQCNKLLKWQFWTVVSYLWHLLITFKHGFVWCFASCMLWMPNHFLCVILYKLSIPFYFVLKHAVGFFCCPIYIASAHRPINSFLVVANFCYQDQDQVARQICGKGVWLCRSMIR